jgi:hypothetical protein
VFNATLDLLEGLWCLMPLSTIFQLHFCMSWPEGSCRRSVLILNMSHALFTLDRINLLEVYLTDLHLLLFSNLIPDLLHITVKHANVVTFIWNQDNVS